MQIKTVAGKEKSINESELWKALDLDMDSMKTISITGAGGKTSVMFRLAGELEGLGKKVIVTTSTHIYYPEDHQVAVIRSANELKDIRWNDGVLVAGGRVEEVRMPKGGELRRKLKGMEKTEIGGLAAWCDVLLIEADGSRRMPLKVPADHEPVIIPETDAVIGCAGLTCVGKSWEEGCFRPELAKTLLEEAGCTAVQRIRPDDVAHILTSRHGTRKQVDLRPYRIVLNQADNEEMTRMGQHIARKIGRCYKVPVIITSHLTES